MEITEYGNSYREMLAIELFENRRTRSYRHVCPPAFPFLYLLRLFFLSLSTSMPLHWLQVQRLEKRADISSMKETRKESPLKLLSHTCTSSHTGKGTRMRVSRMQK